MVLQLIGAGTHCFEIKMSKENQFLVLLSLKKTNKQTLNYLKTKKAMIVNFVNGLAYYSCESDHLSIV